MKLIHTNKIPLFAFRGAVSLCPNSSFDESAAATAAAPAAASGYDAYVGVASFINRFISS